MRKYVMDDVLVRALQYLGYKVQRVMNITDVGHLTGDDDSGEDKLEKGAKKTGKSVWDVVKFYTEFFFKTTDSVNIPHPSYINHTQKYEQQPFVYCNATEEIPLMIDLIKKLQEKGHIYETKEALYFDITTFPTYGKLSGQSLDEKQKAVREEVYADPDKKHPADFAVWFKRVGRFADHTMHWDSPWGDGFPGWHIECSAMAMHYLGESIDIHTGGIDHIPVHHENEIAQSEGATGKQFVKYWVHHNFLQVDGQKMSKSLGNFYTVDDVIQQGIDPVAMRLLFLQTHYRQVMNFTWESAKAANEAYKRLKENVIALRSQTARQMLSEDKLAKVDDYRAGFTNALANDLQTPQAVAIMWDVVKSNIPSEDKLDLLYEFDQVLGLGLADVQEEEIPEEITKLAQERQQMRADKKWAESDELRKKIEEKGYIVEDVAEGFRVKKT
jgi:cysteinyl-tRNA synthetase